MSAVDAQAMRHHRLAEVRVICHRLNERARELAPDLLPNGRLDGRHWRCGSVAGEPGNSLICDISGPNVGHWIDLAACEGMSGRSGDLLDLVAAVKFGGRKAEAIAWARSWLGMDNLDPRRLATEQAQVNRKRAKAEADAARSAERMQRAARALFIEKAGAVRITDTPAEWYLAGRGIDLACLEVDGQQYVPGALAFHPAVRCREAGEEARLPAMIARVLDGRGHHVATHRTWLADGPAGWGKAPLEKAKKALGEYKGGYIPLWKGACRKTLAEITPGTDVFVSEGIEDGLSIAIARPQARVIAALSLSNLGNIELPPQAGRLVVIAQNDPAGSKAAEALRVSIERQQARGATVATMMPPAGFKDWNDVLRGQRTIEEAAA